MGPMNLAKTMVSTCARCADRTYLAGTVDANYREWRFREFRSRVEQWAAALATHGVGEGDRVAFITPKSPNQTFAFYAVWWLGAIAVPISETLADLEMAFILRDSEPTVVLVDETMAGKVRRVTGGATECVFRFASLSQPTASQRREPVVGEADATAALIYTSGSTGMPKGVMLSHRNLLVNARSSLDSMDLNAADTFVSLLPYWHSFALTVEVVLSMEVGYRVTIPKDRRDFAKNVANYKPTVILLVPRIAAALLTGIRKKLSSSSPGLRRLFDLALYNASRIFHTTPGMRGGILRMLAHKALYDPIVFRKVRRRFGGCLRFFVSGGAPLDLEPQLFFKYVGVPIHQGYGLTESSPTISVNSDASHRLGSCGSMLSWLTPEGGGDWTFLDEEGDTGKDRRGELLVRGDCVMQGYWRHRDDSAKTCRDGWLHTGDMGYVEDGFLFLDGRQGNMIVLLGGEKVHPEHIEDAIKGSPLVSEAMVFGDKCKNLYVCVNVDPEEYAALPEGEAMARLWDEVRVRTQHLAPFQRPKDVLVLPDFTIEEGTLTATLKIRRHKVWEVSADPIRAFLKKNNEELVARDDDGDASAFAGIGKTLASE
ncbi:MAG: AMP-binding protein [Victivallales bacterium]|jgi:long-chain acyl-CoA synthetase|nr:AMP-binding protein [Victivallales bacterium]